MRRALVLIALWLVAAPVEAQNHTTLRFLTPLPVDAVGTGLEAENRIYWAYVGLEYNIRAAVVGGRYPYTFTLSGHPSGMTVVNASTNETCSRAEAEASSTLTHVPCGEIRWTPANVTDDDASITITARDGDGDEVSATWGITVVGTESTKFKFIDAAAGVHASGNGCSSSCGTGTLANPWRSISDGFVGNWSASDITYFRSGTYDVDDITPAGSGDSLRVEVNEYSGTPKSVIWLEYPGATAIIDLLSTGAGDSQAALQFVGDNVYLDSLTFTNCKVYCIRFVNETDLRGLVVRRGTLPLHYTSEEPGFNASHIMTASTGSSSIVWGSVIQDNTFGTSTSNFTKIYSQNLILIEDNIVTGNGGAELKADVTDFTFRSNHISTSMTTRGIAGNFNPAFAATRGEIAFNLVKDAPTAAIALGNAETNPFGPVYVYRNTFIGVVSIENLDTGDGPYAFTQNVIENAGGSGGDCPTRFTCTSVTNYTLVTSTNDFTDTDAVDANGELTGANLTNHGPAAATPKGHMTYVAVAAPVTPAGITPGVIRRRRP